MRESYLTEVPQLMSVRVWIQTWIRLLSEAQHPSAHGTISLFNGQEINGENTVAREGIGFQLPVESSSPPSGSGQWGCLPPTCLSGLSVFGCPLSASLFEG